MFTSHGLFVREAKKFTRTWRGVRLQDSRQPGGLRKGERGLGERVFPAGRSADVRVAEPQSVLERPSVLGSLRPEQRRDDRSVAPDPDPLLAVLLTLVDVSLAPRLGEEIGLRVHLAHAGDEDE